MRGIDIDGINLSSQVVGGGRHRHAPEARYGRLRGRRDPRLRGRRPHLHQTPRRELVAGGVDVLRRPAPSDPLVRPARGRERVWGAAVRARTWSSRSCIVPTMARSSSCRYRSLAVNVRSMLTSTKSGHSAR